MKHGMLSNSLFLALTQLVERISAEAKEAHFVGDFNIDLLLRNDSQLKTFDTFNGKFRFTSDDIPTRITEQSKTLRDHHYCIHPEHVVCTFSS